ncbi:hypothetical protein Q8F55_007969 [Vanrija albida]|uniref:PH-response regulator protein palC n=1 Tax=Vanrija albida TaxID=181172 RepID=A0ABR3PV17_9TREE
MSLFPSDYSVASRSSSPSPSPSSPLHPPASLRASPMPRPPPLSPTARTGADLPVPTSSAATSRSATPISIPRTPTPTLASTHASSSAHSRSVSPVPPMPGYAYTPPIPTSSRASSSQDNRRVRSASGGAAGAGEDDTPRPPARERSTSAASPLTKLTPAVPTPSSWTPRERSASAASAPASHHKDPARRPSLASVNTGPAHTELRRNDDGFEATMHRGIAYETHADSIKHAGEQGLSQLRKAAMQFANALIQKPSNPWASLRRSTVLLHLSGHPSTAPTDAVAHLREARSLLSSLAAAAPHSTSAREALAAVCTRLSHVLLALDDHADDPAEVWEGEVGQYACEALDALEEVAAERMDRARGLKREAFEDDTPALADMFLALAEAASAVASLAIDVDTVDMHGELAEHALDQAANMATLAASVGRKPSHASAAIITRVQLASGRAAAERLRRLFHLGIPLDLDDFDALTGDMEVLVEETRERVARLKGSRGTLASAQAFEASKQLGESKLLYANLLRMSWRSRAGQGAEYREQSLPSSSSSERPFLSPVSTPGLQRADSASTASGTIESPPIVEETEEEVAVAEGRRPSLARTTSSASVAVPRRKRAPPPPPLTLVTNGHGPPPPLPPLPPHLASPALITPRTPLSPLNPMAQDPLALAGANVSGGPRRLSEASHALQRPRLTRTGSSFSHHLPSPRTAVWQAGVHGTPDAGTPLPSPGLQPGSPGLHRRLSSMTSPLYLGAWHRKGSFPGFSPDAVKPDPMDDELAQTAWALLDGGLKNLKMSINHLLSGGFSAPEAAHLKSQVLFAISSTLLFQASLVPRLRNSPGHTGPERPLALLVTAEVYAKWAAREVGWSEIIEGSPAAAIADRRIASWEADEAGKRGVLLLLRVWWFRASAEDGADKEQAKSSVEVVVRRMRDREGLFLGHY